MTQSTQRVLNAYALWCHRNGWLRVKHQIAYSQLNANSDYSVYTRITKCLQGKRGLLSADKDYKDAKIT